MVTRLLSCILLGFLINLQISAQDDSLSLQLDELGLEYLKEKDQISDDQKMITGGRFLQNKDELPYTAFIVTKQEILDNGYITLTDVMKSLPGIRVSQSGSGADGETFMLRGLLGNSHMKILLNDNPVKPSVVKGMPLGAQLPIRQAERIEIIYGPAAVLYGADASVGVINIITKQSERPIYAQADLSVGSNGFSSIDVMFGGKLGKNKHVLRYNVYGSNTVMNTRNIFYDKEVLYNPNFYTPNPDNLDTNYVNNPNFTGTALEPEIGSAPHLSRLVGFHLNYRDLSLSGQAMYRRDHSSIGLNPLAVSYTDPGNFIGESIIKTNVAYNKNYKKWGLKTNINYLRYAMDNNSSYTYVEDKLSKALNRFTMNIDDMFIRDSIRGIVYNQYFSDTRYTYALSNDTKVEQLFYINPTDFMNITVGANVDFSIGLSQAYYLEDRYDNTGIVLASDPRDIPLGPELFSFFDWNVFIKNQFDLKKFKGVLGYQFYQHGFYGNAHTPQVALLYKINKSLNLRGSYSSAFRVPSAFYRANTFEFVLANLGGWNGLNNESQDLNPENTQAFEIGIRYNSKSIFKADVSLFHTQTFNFISYNFENEIEFDSGLQEYILGYFNDDNSKAILYGIQANLEANWNLDRLKTKALLNLNYNRGKEILPSGNGTLNLVRGQPDFMAQLNLSFRFWKESFYVNLTNNYVSSFVTTNVFDAAQFNEDRASFSNDGFYTLDILTRYRISRNFQGYVTIKNVFNKQYAGIDATGTIDDLYYNPQSLRTFSFGLSYRIE